MNLVRAAAVLLLASSVLAGCSESATCEDVDDLTAQLDETSPDDPGYNDLVEELNLAEADCNS
jgi:major membrane immunogen (membrane-anchored lipoprotein)